MPLKHRRLGFAMEASLIDAGARKPAETVAAWPQIESRNLPASELRLA
jgi:hypothetical protein